MLSVAMALAAAGLSTAQDCSGLGVTWGPNIARPPPGCDRDGLGGGGGGGGWGGAVDSGNMEINTEVVSFSLDESAFGLVNATGDRVLYTGERSLIVSRGTGTDVTLKVTIE